MLAISSLLFGFLMSGVYGLDCPFGWTPTFGLCLRNIGRQTFSDAVEACKNSGGRLFEPRSEKLSDLLETFLSTSERYAWMGIEDNKYVSDYEPIDYRMRYYVYRIATLNYRGYWIGRTSSRYYSYLAVCELPLTNTACATVGTIFVEDSFTVSDNNTCLDACASTVGCRFWTFDRGQCGLRFFEAGALVGGGIPGVGITGFPNSVAGTGGRVLVGKAVQNIKNASECQKLCFQDPKCNTFTWINKDEIFGGINDETCVFNYGKTLREIPLPGTAAFNVVSGPRSCETKSAGY